MIFEKAASILRGRTFVGVATADKSCEPHSAPKFLFKITGNTLLLIDHAIAKTVENLRVNPRACVSLMDFDELEGYRMSGPVTLVESGPEFEKITAEFEKKLISLSASRLIEGMKKGKPTEHFELEMPNRIIVIKLKVEEVVRIGRQGELFREKPLSDSA